MGWRSGCLLGPSWPPSTDQPPGLCSQTDQFAFVGETTLRALDFAAFGRASPDDLDRSGVFWVTAVPIEIPRPSAAPPRRPTRMVCVEWADGGLGFESGSIEDDWTPPPELDPNE